MGGEGENKHKKRSSETVCCSVGVEELAAATEGRRGLGAVSCGRRLLRGSLLAGRHHSGSLLLTVSPSATVR